MSLLKEVFDLKLATYWWVLIEFKTSEYYQD